MCVCVQKTGSFTIMADIPGVKKDQIKVSRQACSGAAVFDN